MNEVITGAEQVCPAPAEKNEVTAVAEIIKKASLGPNLPVFSFPSTGLNMPKIFKSKDQHMV